MSTALTVVPTNQEAVALAGNYAPERLSSVQRLGSILAASGYFSDMKDAAQGAVKVMAGEELGIAPVAAVMGIHIIKGKVALSANLIASQVRRHGYDFRANFSADGCILQFFGKKGELLGDSSFTEADAKLAGVYSDMYRKFPRNMYWSRAMSNGAKWYCPEVMSGMPIYTPEELGAKVDGDGEVIHSDQPGTQTAADAVAAQKLEALRAESEARKAAPKPAAPTEIIPGEVQAMFARMRDIKSTIEVLGELKGDIKEAIGTDAGERLYYTVLGKQGVDHANQFKSTKPARVAVRELYDAIKAANSGDALGINEGDIPQDFREGAE